MNSFVKPKSIFSLLLLGVIVYAYGDLEGVRQG